MQTSAFDYPLPPGLVAQEPPAVRGSSRMLVLDRRADTIRHLRVGDLPAFARAGDLLVVNDTKVFPARLLGHWADTGVSVEALLLEEEAGAPGRWRALLGSGRRVRPGLRALFADGALPATVAGRARTARRPLRFEIASRSKPLLERTAPTPCPLHPPGSGGDAAARRLDRERYRPSTRGTSARSPARRRAAFHRRPFGACGKAAFGWRA